MRTVVALTGKEPLVQDITRLAFPSYRGRKFKLVVTDRPIDVATGNYWDGGTKSYWAFVNIDTRRSVTMPSMHPAFDKSYTNHDTRNTLPATPGKIDAKAVPLPPGVVAVEHSIFVGKDFGITIHAHPNTISATALTPTSVDLTPVELRVLKATISYIPSARLQESGLSRREWEEGKASLIAKGLLNKAGAITVAGRNAHTSLRESRSFGSFYLYSQ